MAEDASISSLQVNISADLKQLATSLERAHASLTSFIEREGKRQFTITANLKINDSQLTAKLGQFTSTPRQVKLSLIGGEFDGTKLVKALDAISKQRNVLGIAPELQGLDPSETRKKNQEFVKQLGEVKIPAVVEYDEARAKSDIRAMGTLLSAQKLEVPVFAVLQNAAAIRKEITQLGAAAAGQAPRGQTPPNAYNLPQNRRAAGRQQRANEEESIQSARLRRERQTIGARADITPVAAPAITTGLPPAMAERLEVAAEQADRLQAEATARGLGAVPRGAGGARRRATTVRVEDEHGGTYARDLRRRKAQKGPEPILPLSGPNAPPGGRTRVQQTIPNKFKGTPLEDDYSAIVRAFDSGELTSIQARRQLEQLGQLLPAHLGPGGPRQLRSFDMPARTRGGKAKLGIEGYISQLATATFKKKAVDDLPSGTGGYAAIGPRNLAQPTVPIEDPNAQTSWNMGGRQFVGPAAQKNQALRRLVAAGIEKPTDEQVAGLKGAWAGEGMTPQQRAMLESMRTAQEQVATGQFSEPQIREMLRNATTAGGGARGKRARNKELRGRLGLGSKFELQDPYSEELSATYNVLDDKTRRKTASARDPKTNKPLSVVRASTGLDQPPARDVGYAVEDATRAQRQEEIAADRAAGKGFVRAPSPLGVMVGREENFLDEATLNAMDARRAIMKVPKADRSRLQTKDAARLQRQIKAGRAAATARQQESMLGPLESHYDKPTQDAISELEQLEQGGIGEDLNAFRGETPKQRHDREVAATAATKARKLELTQRVAAGKEEARVRRQATYDKAAAAQTVAPNTIIDTASRQAGSYYDPKALLARQQGELLGAESERAAAIASVRGPQQVPLPGAPIRATATITPRQTVEHLAAAGAAAGRPPAAPPVEPAALAAGRGVVPVNVVQSIPLTFVGGAGAAAAGAGPAAGPGVRPVAGFATLTGDPAKAVEANKKFAEQIKAVSGEDIPTFRLALKSLGYDAKAIDDFVKQAFPQNAAPAVAGTNGAAPKPERPQRAQREAGISDIEEQQRVARQRRQQGRREIVEATPARAFPVGILQVITNLLTRSSTLGRIREAEDLERKLAISQRSQAREALAVTPRVTTLVQERRAAQRAGDSQRVEELSQSIRTETARHHEASRDVGKYSSRLKRADEALNKNSAIVANLSAGLVGGIAGSLLFGVAMGAVTAGLELLGKAIAPAVDRATGYAQTTAAVTGALAEQTKAVNGNAAAATANTISMTAASEAQRQFIQPALEERAATQTANANLQAQTDQLRASERAGAGQFGGFDRNLFSSTGGLFDTSFLAPAQSTIEQFTKRLEERSQAQRQAENATNARQNRDPLTGFAEDPYGFPLSENTLQGLEEGLKRSANDIVSWNNTLTKAGDGFNVAVTTNTESLNANKKALDELQAAYPELTPQITNLRDQLKDVAITRGGRAVSGGADIIDFFKSLTTGALRRDPESILAGQKNAISAQTQLFAAERAFQTQQQIPAQFALQEAIQPTQRFGVGIFGEGGRNAKELGLGGADAQQFNKFEQESNDLFEQIQQDAKEGRKAMLDIIAPLPPQVQTQFMDTFDEITALGSRIAEIQRGLSFEQASLSIAQYNTQIKFTKIALSDALQLAGKRGQVDNDNIGALERQNELLRRQSQELSFQLQQRRINFQLAIAGFQAPGLTSEERRARIEEARIEAQFAQKQLNIQKQQAGIGVKIFDRAALRQVAELRANLDLLERGRTLVIHTQAANDVISKMEKRVAALAAKAQAYLDNGTKIANAYMQAAAAIVAETGGNMNKILRQTARAWGVFATQYIEAWREAMYGIQGGGRDSRRTTTYTQGATPNAAGALFQTTGTQSLIVGEAGSETVAILRNPRTTTAGAIDGGGGGGGVTINFNGAMNVRDDNDIKSIAREVERLFNSKGSLIGMRSLTR